MSQPASRSAPRSLTRLQSLLETHQHSRGDYTSLHDVISAYSRALNDFLNSLLSSPVCGRRARHVAETAQPTPNAPAPQLGDTQGASNTRRLNPTRSCSCMMPIKINALSGLAKHGFQFVHSYSNYVKAAGIGSISGAFNILVPHSWEGRPNHSLTLSTTHGCIDATVAVSTISPAPSMLSPLVVNAFASTGCVKVDMSKADAPGRPFLHVFVRCARGDVEVRLPSTFTGVLKIPKSARKEVNVARTVFRRHSMGEDMVVFLVGCDQVVDDNQCDRVIIDNDYGHSIIYQGNDPAAGPVFNGSMSTTKRGRSRIRSHWQRSWSL